MFSFSTRPSRPIIEEPSAVTTSRSRSRSSSRSRSRSPSGSTAASAGKKGVETIPIRTGSATTEEGRSLIESEKDVPSSADPTAATDLEKQVTTTTTTTTSSDAHSSPKPPSDSASLPNGASSAPQITVRGLQVLILLAFQNCSKNLLMRWVMKDQPKFLKSAAVIGSEMTKMTLSLLWVLLVDRAPLSSVFTFLKLDYRNSVLLIVPASAYNLQMSLEYVALANIDAAVFSVLVQLKLLATATFAAVLLRKRLKIVQIVSLVLLTTGVMLINLQKTDMKQKTAAEAEDDGDLLASMHTTGVIATLGIALSSGFASVYTEKVIKAKRNMAQGAKARQNYSLAYMQVQLALVSLIVMGLYALIVDWKDIWEHGLWQNFTPGAFVSVFNSALGGLVVAAVLKYADAVLKGYATAMSVVFTGLLSSAFFHTNLTVLYGLGIINVVCAVLLYNGRNLDAQVGCGGPL